MGVRTGRDYVEGLRARPREVWLRGRRVADVTREPAFVRPLEHMAELYDLQHDPAHAAALTYASPGTGAPVATSFLQPRDTADLKRRSAAFRIAAEATLGLMGRSPDFLNSAAMAIAESRELLAPMGERFVANAQAYYEHVREHDLFLTHAIVTPQSDRSKLSRDQADEFLHLGVVRETADGLIVRGARMLATLGPIVDEVICYNIPNLKAEDARYAMVFALPIDTAGVCQIAREPFDEGGRSTFDHPLAANFEDSDTLIVFDDVLVPWERVFAWNDPMLANRLFVKSGIRHHTGHQAVVRGLVKLEFVTGVAMAVAKAIGADQFLHVQEMLGECVQNVELLRACLIRAEVEPEPAPHGFVRPNGTAINMARALTARCYPRMVEVLQTIGAGGLLMMPSDADFGSAIAGDVAKFYGGAGGLDARERVRLFKLAWDLCGDAFGQRQVQYERYHSGDPVRNTAMTFLGYDKRRCEALVERALDLSRAGEGRAADAADIE